MTDAWYEAFLDLVAEDPNPCKYGHINCSDKQGGICSDEESQYHNQDEEGE
jgi:hypothetical protein